MGRAQTTSATPAATDTPTVLIRNRGDSGLELHFIGLLTSMNEDQPAVYKHDYRIRAAKEGTQFGVAIAYQLFGKLNDIPGLETATAEYRKVTLTFGLVYLTDTSLRGTVNTALETAIKQYLDCDTIRLLWR